MRLNQSNSNFAWFTVIVPVRGVGCVTGRVIEELANSPVAVPVRGVGCVERTTQQIKEVMLSSP